MYKGTSQNQQRRVDFIKLADLVQSGSEILSPEVQWENLRIAVKNIDGQIQAETDPVRRKELGVQKLAIQNEIKEVKKLIGFSKDDVGEFLIRELKQMIPRAQYEIAVKRAKKAFEDWVAAGRPDIDL